ncbi:hypothetical protein NQZ68_004265 [Dissostichus eleginoides]|nr:hypothetical protein NQZ68_004265 [Dissostichus eleginoides]
MLPASRLEVSALKKRAAMHHDFPLSQGSCTRLVVSAAQTGWKPTTVTCEMRICADRTGLNAPVQLLSRANLRRM